MAFHADYLLMTHGNPQVITDFMKNLDESYGKNDPLTVTRGKLHEHLGMTIYFRIEGKCMFSQCDSIKKFWIPLPADLRGPNCVTPATEDSFKVNFGAEN